MTKEIELSFLNETTIIVKDVTVKNRCDNKQFRDVHSDPVYLQGFDDRNYIIFVTGINESGYTKFCIQSFSVDMDLKSSDVKIKWLINNDEVYIVAVKEIKTQSTGGLLGNTNVWYYGEQNEKYGREGGCIYYKVKFLNGLKWRQAVNTFILNKSSNPTAYDTGVGLDFTFVIDGKQIRASKFVLISNSEVFSSMLTNDWKDSRENQVDIKDVEFETMDSFIRAMHGIEQPIKDVAMALKMLVVADKYKVDPLQEQATTFVKSNLDCKNVINAIVLAYQLSFIDLLDIALKYVLNCGKPLSELAGHDQVPQEIAVKMFQTLYENVVKKVQK